MTEHDHDEHGHHHHPMPRCEITVTITADHPFGAGQVLKHISRLLKDGEVAADGVNVKYGAEWSVIVEPVGDPDALPHENFWDGEHNHIHVDSDGFVVSRQGPDADDGTPDFEDMRPRRIKLSEWAESHGGITPFGTDEDPENPQFKQD